MTKYFVFVLIFLFARNGDGTLVDSTVQQIPSISLGIGIDMESLESSIQIFEDMFTMLTEDLIVEEAIESFPEIFNMTTFAIPDRTDFITQYGLAPVYEGVFRSPNGTDIVLEVIQNPELLIDTFFTLISNLDLDELRQEDLFDLLVTNWGLSFAVPLLQPPFNEYIVDVVVTITLALANGFPTGVESVTNVLEPLLETLETSGDTSGLLQIFPDLGSLSDVVVDYLAQAFEQFSIELREPEKAELLANLVGQFMVEFQKSLGLDDSQLFQLVIDVFIQILNSLP